MRKRIRKRIRGGAHALVRRGLTAAAPPRHLFRIASGSAAELQAALRAAFTWGNIDDPAEPLALADRLRGRLYGRVRRGCTSR